MERSCRSALLTQHIEQAFRLTEDLAETLPQHAFLFKLRDMPSNTIGQQFWCIVGARESYLKAIKAEGWSGFHCSLKDTTAENIRLRLRETHAECLSYLTSHPLTEVQIELLLQLLEHEIQHHGQLIRYVYGNALTFPASWKERYTV